MDNIPEEYDAARHIIKVSDDENGYDIQSFSISIIPHTWENTSIKFNKVGDLMNTEIDMLARYVHGVLKK